MTATAKPRKVTWNDLADVLTDQVPFDGNSVRARRDWDPNTNGPGRLSAADRVLFYEDERHQYVVWSYATPIAWVTASGRVIIPDAKYSATTTRYQNKCRAWLRAR